MAVDKLVDSTQLDSDLTSVANAIRTKGGTSAQLAFPNGFVSAIDAIPTGGTLITKTITENGTYSAEDDDADGYSEVTVNVPSGGMDYLALRATNQLTSYENSEITTVKDFTFRACTNLTSINLPNLVTIGTCGFYGCTGLTRVFFDNLTATGNQGFMTCTNLKTFVSKKAIYSQSGSDMSSCTNLEAFDMGSGNGRLSGSFFSSDGKLKTMVIRSNTVTTLPSTNAFNGTPFASGGTGGTLYVPSNMISSYQSASNWSTILGYANNQIKSIESTHTDPTAPIDLTLYYADGTPIST